MPFAGHFGAIRPSALLENLARPLGVTGVEQRQIEQPFARIIHDVEGKRTRPGAPPAFALILDIDPQLADPAGGLRPAALGGERLHVLLKGEARHGVVGLGGQVGAADPALGGGAESRQVGAAGQMMHQGGGEDGLARTGKAGDAETQGGLDELARGLPERLRRGAGAGGDISEHRHLHASETERSR